MSEDITSCFVFLRRGVKIKLDFVCTLNTSKSPSYARFTEVSVHGRPVAVCGRKDLFLVLLISNCTSKTAFNTLRKTVYCRLKCGVILSVTTFDFASVPMATGFTVPTMLLLLLMPPY